MLYYFAAHYNLLLPNYLLLTLWSLLSRKELLFSNIGSIFLLLFSLCSYLGSMLDMLGKVFGLWDPLRMLGILEL